MIKKGAEFGWVIQPAPATAAGAATLNDDNLRFLNLIRSEFQSVWFEDHFLDVGRYGHDEITPSAFHFVNLSGQPTSSSVYTLGEDADTVTRQLEEFVALGARHFMLRFTDFPSTRGIEEFLQKVLPRFR